MEGQEMAHPVRNALGVALFLLPAAIFFVGLINVFGCGWGTGYPSFTCRIATPALLVGPLFAIFFAGIGIWLRIHGKKMGWSGRLYASVLIAPIILLLLPSIVPPGVNQKWLEGITAEACSTGQPIVPWGQHMASDSCFYTVGLCDQIQDAHTEKSCYAYKSGKVFTSYSDCDGYKNVENITACKIEIAKRIQDLDFCRTVMAQFPSERDALRVGCAAEVTGITDDFGKAMEQGVYANAADFNPNDCRNYSGTKQDACYAYIATLQDDIGVCGRISTLNWLRQSCEISIACRVSNLCAVQ